MIIILNGTSSSGMSTLAHAIHMASKEPFLTFCRDAFLNMLSPRYDGRGVNHKQKRHGDYLKGFYTSDVEVGYRIEVGELGQKLIWNFPKALRCVASSGLNIVTPAVVLGRPMLQVYTNELRSFDTYLIYVECAYEERERRERERGDRPRGTSVDILNRMEVRDTYDYKVDTTNQNTKELAENILAYCYANKPKIFL